jgi:hypothetical protein
MLAWYCASLEADDPVCPEAEPPPETQCTSLLNAATCTYGSNVACHCAQEAQTWACWNPADCPNRKPERDSTCASLGMTCGYGSDACECLSTGWRCAPLSL